MPAPSSGAGTGVMPAKAGEAAAWLLFGGFWLLLLVLAAAETLRPLHCAPVEARGRLLTNFAMGLIAEAAAFAAAMWSHANLRLPVPADGLGESADRNAASLRRQLLSPLARAERG
jgi:hypothetical protein